MKSIELQAKVIFAALPPAFVGFIYKHKHSLTCKHDESIVQEIFTALPPAFVKPVRGASGRLCEA